MAIPTSVTRRPPGRPRKAPMSPEEVMARVKQTAQTVDESISAAEGTIASVAAAEAAAEVEAEPYGRTVEIDQVRPMTAEQIRRRDEEEAREQEERRAHAKEGVADNMEYAESKGVRLRQPKAFSKLDVTAKMRRNLGIPEHMDVEWIRNPRIWEHVEMTDRIDDYRNAMDGATPVRNADGELVTSGDLVLMKLPNKHRLEKERAEREEADKLYNHFNDRGVSIPDLSEGDESRLNYERIRDHAGPARNYHLDRAHQNAREAQMRRMIGRDSPSYRKTMEQYMQQVGEEQVAKEAYQARRGTMSAGWSEEAYRKELDKRRNYDEDQGVFRSIPAKVAPKNLAGSKK